MTKPNEPGLVTATAHITVEWRDSEGNEGSARWVLRHDQEIDLVTDAVTSVLGDPDTLT